MTCFCKSSSSPFVWILGIITYVLFVTGCGGSSGSNGGNTSPPTITSVTASCTPTSVITGQTSQCSATVQGTGAFSSSVTWAVDSIANGNSTVGIISSAGLYTAPATVPNPATVTVMATSVQDGSKSGSTQITIFASGGTGGISNVQCGDAATGTFIACPIPGAGANPTVTVGGIDTSFPSTGAYVDFKWTTPNCSSSIVVFMRDINYAPERYWQGDATGADGCNAGYAKNHRVHANYLVPAYTGLTTPNGNSIAGFSSGQRGHDFYIASQDQANGTWETLGGPCQIDQYHCGTAGPPFGVVAPVPNTALSSSWGVWIYGAQSVYRGHDLYLGMFNVLAQGPVAASVIMPWSSVSFVRQTMADGSPCSSNCTDVQDGTILNLDAAFVDTQQFLNNSATNYANLNIDSSNQRDWSNAGNYRSLDGFQFVRIRTNCNGHGSQAACGLASPTPVGRYQVQATFTALSGSDTAAAVGSPITVTYTFTVLPTASFTATPPVCLAGGSCTAIPCVTSGSCGGLNYEDDLKTWGVIACTGGPSTFMSRLGQEYRYALGDFDNATYNCNTATGCAFLFNYDGGRTFWEASDYAAAHSWTTPAGASLQPDGSPYPNAAAYFHHCALVGQQSYYKFFGGVGAAGTGWPGGYLREWSIFPNGPAMTWWRTGDTTAKQAVNTLGTLGGSGGSHQGSTIYQYYPITYFDAARQSAYQIDSILANWQISGSISTPDSIQLNRLVDTMLAIFEQTGDYDPYGVNYSSIAHPQTWPWGVINRNYMQGVDLESLIEVYEWQKISGVPDARIPLAVKGELDFMWAHMWAYASSGYHSFYYNGYDLPHSSANDNDGFTLLNNLVCPAYAWYWKVSGDSTYLSHGDDCWQNAMSSTNQIYYTGKDFDQLLKWSADYIGYRSINNYTPSTFPANNPAIAGGVPDTVPPVPRPSTLTNTTTSDSPADLTTGIKPVTNISGSSVTITWSTYKALSTAKVDYGLSETYGQSATGTSTNCASIAACNTGCNATVGSTGQTICKESYWNVVTITGLSPSTTYHFRTVGIDALGNTAVSNTSPGITGTNKDFTFLTGSGH